MTTLVLYFNPEAGQNSVYWLKVANNTPAEVNTCHVNTLDTVADTVSADRVIVVVAGEQVLSTIAELATRKSLQALPYIVEEKLASPVEELHIAHNLLTSKKALVCVIESGVLNGLLNILEEQSIHADKFVADYQLLTTAENTINYALIGNRALIRAPDACGASVSINDGFLSHLTSYTNCANEIQNLCLTDLMTLAAHTNDAVNLLQGQYNNHRSGQDRKSVFTTMFYTAAGAALLITGYFLVAGLHFSQQADEYYQKSEQIYREIFPNARKITNIRRQMEGHLNNGLANSSEDSGFLNLLALSAPALSQTDSQNIRHIRYDKQQQALQLEIQDKDISTINNLQQLLQKSALNAAILSASSNDAGTLARLRITAR